MKVRRVLAGVVAVTLGMSGLVLAAPNPAMARGRGPCVRTVEVGDYRAFEGNTGPFMPRKTPFTFTLTSSACAAAGSIHYSTISLDSATEDDDFTSVSGMVTFLTSDVSQQAITVEVRRDNVPEPDETFLVSVCADSASINVVHHIALGTILNDDGPTIIVNPTTGPELHCAE